MAPAKLLNPPLRYSTVALHFLDHVELQVHPDPLPALKQTYDSTLMTLRSLPAASTYRQATEAITLARLKIVESAGGDIQKVEQTIGGGQIEEILDAAVDEQNLATEMKERKP
jgi:NADH dehydrogenase (ubiquinone) 1 alpha subcomplex subunit 5